MTAPASPRGALTIRARLTLTYAASVLAAFVLLAIAIRTTVATTLRREFTAGVTSSANALQGFFRLEVAEYGDVGVTLRHIAEELVFPDRVVEFVRPDGGVALRTQAAGARGRSALAAPVEAVTLPLDVQEAPGWRVRVFASAAPLHRSLDRIDQWMLLGIPLGVLLAAGMGWWMAGRTLRPIGTMAEAAARMASERAGDDEAPRRLPIDNPTDEVGRLGTRFNELLDRMDALASQQRRFLADAAHELRTPVARMMGTVDLALLDAPGAPADPHDALVRVRRDLERTARLVDELLQLARADAAGTIQPTAGYLDDLVLDTVHAWMPVSAQRQVALEVDAIEEAPAQFDRVLLERMLGILIDNGLRYTPAGGRVAVSLTTHEGRARLSVTDTGIGMSEAERARAFERFFRGATARRLSPDGSGLGLAIASWIARAHGAQLRLDAPPQGGTRVTIDFTRTATTAPTLPPTADGAFMPGSPLPATLPA